MASVTVVGLGPAGPELLTAAATAAVAATPVRFLRTRRHPAASAVPAAESFDDEYERATSLDHVYPRIVERLVAAAEEHGRVLYAVPGSARVAEHSVELLVADPRVEVEVVPALSFLDLVWDRLGVDPLAGGVRLVDGRRFAVEAAGERGPLVVAQCDSPAVLSEVKLAVASPPASVVVLQRLGLADEVVTEVAWDDLDRSVVPDHLTSLWVPELASPVGAELVRFAELVRTLRARCPWDREQTHTSLTRHLLEETYELLEAIEVLDDALGAGEDDAVDAAYEHLEEELGDVLFQVFFHATLGAEAGRFDVADVARGIHDKLVHRHPHVFADTEVTGADDVMRNWERLKQDEKGRASVMDGVPANLPSLLYAFKVQRKAEALGVEAEAPGTLRLSELSTPADLGQALFATVAVARRLRLDPEAALRAAAASFRDDVAAREGGGGPA
ncbi:MAG: MazG family protein [Actinobacteria bacterium]|nr:MazG family protein [Actinomycetota bacterium]